MALAGLALLPGRPRAQGIPGAGAPSAQRIPLWPAGVLESPPAGLAEHMEGAGIAGVTEPRIEVMRPSPSVDAGRAILLIPGGGYRRLAVNNAPAEIGRFLLAQGFTVCLLIYRLPGEGWRDRGLASLRDAQRAMRLIRSRATVLGVDADKVGVVGSSAGGHLAGMLAVGGAQRAYAAIDAADEASARPAYAGLLYPVVSMENGLTHTISRENFLGDRPSADAIAAASLERLVTTETPPTFIAAAADDGVVQVANSLALSGALIGAKVPGELHVFEQGGHGFGIAPPSTAAAWPQLFMRWRARHDPLAGRARAG